MKRKTINKQIYDNLPRHNNAGKIGPNGLPAKGFGAMNYATGALGMLSNVYGNLNQPYNYQPQFKQSTIGGVGYQEEQDINPNSVDTTGSALSGAASGAAAGATLGLPGMLGGAAIGALTSWYGADKKKDAMKAEREKIKQRNAFNAAGAHTKGLQNEWNMNGIENNMQYVANGGTIFNPNARVDEGEVIQEPNGNMETVENSNPNFEQVQPNTTDGYVANLKEGTRILSNKIRIPGSKQTFAEAGQKIESKLNSMKKREPKSHIEANTARLNEYNLQKQYNDLFEQQEAVKGLKMRPEGSYAKGGQVGMTGMMKARMALANEFGNESAKRMVSSNPDTYTFTGNEITPTNEKKGNVGTHYIGSYGNIVRPSIQNINGKLEYTGFPSKRDNEDITFENATDAAYFAEHYKDIAPMMKSGKFAKGGKVQTVSDGYRSVQYGDLPGFSHGIEYYKGLGNAIKKGLSNNSDLYNDDLILAQHKSSYGNNVPTVGNSAESTNNQSSTWDDIKNLAPSLMNIGYSLDTPYKAQTITPELMVSDNPYEGQVLNALKKRRARIQPLLDQNNINSTIARYNSRMQGTGGRAYDVATTAGKMRADQDAITSTNKINDSYLTDYANTLNQIGQQKANQMANAKQYASQYNANQMQQQYQAEQGRKDLLNAGMKGISNYNQLKISDAKKNAMDLRMAALQELYLKSKDKDGAAQIGQLIDFLSGKLEIK